MKKRDGVLTVRAMKETHFGRGIPLQARHETVGVRVLHGEPEADQAESAAHERERSCWAYHRVRNHLAARS